MVFVAALQFGLGAATGRSPLPNNDLILREATLPPVRIATMEERVTKLTPRVQIRDDDRP
jgi:hypothetical protein